MKRHASQQALEDIIKAMKSLRLEKMQGFKSKEDNDAKIEIEKIDRDEARELLADD